MSSKVTSFASTAAITQLHAQIRSNYTKGLTWTYEFRMGQLKQLEKMLTENQKEWAAALKSDLGLKEGFGFFREYNVLTKEEFAVARKNLKSWMKPVSAEVPAWLQPASCTVHKHPKGVVLIISPWNYPVALCINPLIGAIAAGCAAVIKPSEVSPACSALFARLVPRYLSPEVFACVEGGPVETQALLKLQWDHIFYTGNTTVGKLVMQAAAEHLTPVTLELGGKSPCIVDRDADLDVAAKRIILGKFNNLGQTCVAPDYLLLHRDIAAKMTAKLAETVRTFYTENPKTCEDYSRVINERHTQRLASLLQKDTSGKVVCGGADTVDVSQRYLAPTLVADVAADGELMKDEIFGPVLPMMTVNSVDEALTFIGGRPRPLAAYYFGRTQKHIDDFLKRVDCGGACINEVTYHCTVAGLPFGGIGPSGMGAYHGKASFDTFTHDKSVLNKPTLFDPSLKYPPFTPGKVKLVGLLLDAPSTKTLLRTLLAIAVIGAAVYFGRQM